LLAAVAVFAAVPVWALDTASDSATVQLRLTNSLMESTQPVGVGPVASQNVGFLYFYRPADTLHDSAPKSLALYGARGLFEIGKRGHLTSGVFYSRVARGGLAAASRPLPGSALGLTGFAANSFAEGLAVDSRDVLSGDRIMLQNFTYDASSRLKLSAGYREVGKDFVGFRELASQMPGLDAGQLEQAKGTRTLNLGAAFDDSRGARLNFAYQRLYDDRNPGRTTSSAATTLNAEHTFGQGRLKLSAGYRDIGNNFTGFRELASQMPGLDAGQLEQAKGTRTFDLGAAFDDHQGTRLNLAYRQLRDTRNTGQAGGSTTANLSAEHSFGQGRMLRALYETATPRGGETATTLSLHGEYRVNGRLNLAADSVRKSLPGGRRDDNLTLQASGNLGQTALSLTHNIHDATGSGSTATTTLGLNTRLSLLGNSWTLGGRYTLANASQTDTRTSTADLNLSGALGRGVTTLAFNGTLKDVRVAGGSQSRNQASRLHAELPNLPWVKVSADLEQAYASTAGRTATDRAQRVINFSGKLGDQSDLRGTLLTIADQGGTVKEQRDYGAQYRAGRYTVNAGLLSLYTGGAAENAQFLNTHIAMGRPIADWAKDVSNGGLFGDREQYGFRRLPSWHKTTGGGLDLGYKVRQGGPRDGMVSHSLSYNDMLGGRFHYLVAYSENPEFTEDDKKGQIQEARRVLFELATPVSRKVTLLGRYVEDQSLIDTSGVGTTLIALQGRLSSIERVEFMAARDDGINGGRAIGATSFGLLYERHVSDSNYIVFKTTMIQGSALDAAASNSLRFDIRLQKDL
jgi:hypothetical protein